MTQRVVALGFFDGVHLGHGALLQRTRQRANERCVSAAAMTLDRHPSTFLRSQPVPLLNTPQDRALLMQRLYQIDEVIFAPFDRAMLQAPWEQFLSDYLVGTLHACHAVCGHNYHFGYQGEGTPEKLQQWCQAHGLGCDIIPQVELDGDAVSSTRIRTLLQNGELEAANRLLGHPHCLTGTVVHGQKLGSTLGIPTANLAMPDGLLTLPFGVYATQVWIDGTPHMAVTNVGRRPTVQGKNITVEPWILDFEADLYGHTIRVDFHTPIRPEQKFPSLQAMQEEIRRNADQTRAYFASK